MANLWKVLVFLLLNYMSTGICAPTAKTTTKTNAIEAFGVKRRGVSGIYILITLGLKTKLKDSDNLMLKKYTFINKSSFLLPPIINLGLLNFGNIDCGTMSTDDKYKALYRQFLAYLEPMRLACEFEAVPLGSKNDAMSKSLNLTRAYLRTTVYELEQILTKRKVPIPTITKVTESSMNNTIIWFLNTLQKQNLGVPPTNSNVKIYRNYVILDSMDTAMFYLQPCIPY